MRGRYEPQAPIARTAHQRRRIPMSVARVTEIKASSGESFDAAIREGLARACKTLNNVRSAWIDEQEVLLDEKGNITTYRVLMKITFILDD